MMITNAGRLASFGLVALSACIAVDGALADAAPDSARLAELRAQLAVPRIVRVIGTFGVRDIRNPLLDSTGVRSADWAGRARQRPALFLAGGAAPAQAPPPIAWSSISEMQMQSGRSRAGQGALLGFVAGLAIGGTLALNNSSADEGVAFRNLGLGLGAIVAGPFIGSTLFSIHRWHTIYRAPAPS